MAERVDWDEVEKRPTKVENAVVVVARGSTGEIHERIWLEERPGDKSPYIEVELLADMTVAETTKPFEVSILVKRRWPSDGIEVVGKTKRERVAW